MNNLLAPIQMWGQSLSQREQRLVIVCTVLALVGVLYWGVVQPVLVRADNAKLRSQSEKQLLSWVKDKADEINQLQGLGSQSVSNLPINQAVSSSVARFKVELIRVQPRGEQFQVWIAPMAFNQFMRWVTFLQEDYGISIVLLDLDKGDQEGMIEVNRLQFGRGQKR